MLIAFTIVGILVCAACIPLAHLEPAQQCHLLDHDWREMGPRDWCICDRCGVHEYYFGAEPDFHPRPIPYRIRYWWNRSTWPHRQHIGELMQGVRNHFGRCPLCQQRNSRCDCLPF